MSEAAPERPAGGGKKLFGLPRNYVIIGGTAFAATILYLWWKNRKNAASQQGTSASGQQFTTQGIDYAGELSTIESQLQQLTGQGAASGGGGGYSGGGGGYLGGGSGGGGYTDSYGGGGSGGGAASYGSYDAGSGQGTSTTPSAPDQGGATSGGTTSSGGTTTQQQGPPASAPGGIHGSVNGSQLIVSASSVAGATGYEIQVAEPGGQLWHDSRVPVPQGVYSPVPKRGTYYFKMRAYNNSGYGPWTSVAQATVTQ